MKISLALLIILWSCSLSFLTSTSVESLKLKKIIFLRLKLGFPIAIPLRAIVRNCAELWGVYRAHKCAQVKSTCGGIPNKNTSLKIGYFIPQFTLIKRSQWLKQTSMLKNCSGLYVYILFTLQDTNWKLNLRQKQLRKLWEVESFLARKTTISFTFLIYLIKGKVVNGLKKPY